MARPVWTALDEAGAFRGEPSRDRMKVIALLPVRNEAWVLRHSLACLSAFCDVILVNDQASEDASREICREFPKVVLMESPVPRICEQARWELWDAARHYDGYNL